MAGVSANFTPSADPVGIKSSSGIKINPATEEALQNLLTLMGEVQANPTANTVLARLKDLLTGIVLASGSLVTIESPINNSRVVCALAANNAGTPVDTTIYNATQSTQCVSLGGYPRQANALPVNTGDHLPSRFSATTTGTNIKTSAGFVHKIIVNTAGTWAGVVTFVNATSGSTAFISPINIAATDNPQTRTIDIGIAFTTAIRIVITATAGTPEVTVVYD